VDVFIVNVQFAAFSCVISVDSGDYNDGSARCTVCGVSPSAGSVLYSRNVSCTRKIVYRYIVWFVAYVWLYTVGLWL